MFVKRAEDGSILEAKQIIPPEEYADWEYLQPASPENMRLHDPTWSYKQWIKDQIKDDPFMKVIVRRLAQLAGNTVPQEILVMSNIAENILPDPTE